MTATSQIVLLGIAGAAGTLLRAGCNTFAARLLGQAIPWGTLLVNVAGSFAFGAFYGLARTRPISAPHDAVILVGLLGGFTTYSSFAFQSAEMISCGRIAAAVSYVAATNILGLVAVWAGLSLGRWT